MQVHPVPAPWSTALPIERTSEASLPAGAGRPLTRWRIRASNYLFWGVLIVEALCGCRPWEIRDDTLPLIVVGHALVILGLALRSWAAGIIRKSAELACTGPYLLTRHPLYLGSLLIMLGFCTLIGQPLNFVLVLGPVWLTYLATMRHEEELLAARFPDAWQAFLQAHPLSDVRWYAERLTVRWRLAGWLANREYRALGGSLLGLAGIHLWLLAAATLGMR